MLEVTKLASNIRFLSVVWWSVKLRLRKRSCVNNTKKTPKIKWSSIINEKNVLNKKTNPWITRETYC
jgi:hypothetical protein